MAEIEKNVKYGELEKDFFGRCEEMVQTARNKVPSAPSKGESAGRTFMQAYFGHVNAAKGICESMRQLFEATRKKINEAGAEFKDIDESIAYSIEKGC